MCGRMDLVSRGGKGQIREARQEEGKEFKKDSTNSLKEKFRSRRTFIMELIHKKNHFNIVLSTCTIFKNGNEIRSIFEYIFYCKSIFIIF